MKGQQPQWNPVSMLPEFTEMVDGMLGAALEQLATLQTCVDRPGVLDDHTLNRFIVLHTEQLDDHWLYEEQFARWKRGTLDQVEAKEVNRLIDQTTRLKTTNEKILALAEQLAPYTIESKRTMTDSKIESARKLLASGVPPKDVAHNLGVSIPTLYRWLPASERL